LIKKKKKKKPKAADSDAECFFTAHPPAATQCQRHILQVQAWCIHVVWHPPLAHVLDVLEGSRMSRVEGGVGGAPSESDESAGEEVGGEEESCEAPLSTHWKKRHGDPFLSHL
jgi:hypothetical protein